MLVDCPSWLRTLTWSHQGRLKHMALRPFGMGRLPLYGYLGFQPRGAWSCRLKVSMTWGNFSLTKDLYE